MDAMVSAIITTHKRPAAIVQRAIESALNQTVPPYEVFLINDCPEYEGNKDIEKLATHYAGRVKYFYNTTRRGANGSRNIGVEKSSGTIIALLDDDDEWDLRHLEIMVPFITDEVGFVYGKKSVFRDGRVIQKNKKNLHFDGEVFDKLIRYGNFVGGCSIPIFKKDCVIKAGMFDEEMPASQDVDCWIRMARLCKFQYVDQVVAYYYVTPNAITSDPDRRISGMKRTLEKYSEQFQKDPLACRRIKNNMIVIRLTYGDFLAGWKLYREEYDGIGERIRHSGLLIRGIAKCFFRNFGLSR